jgi:hypothetical protein
MEIEMTKKHRKVNCPVVEPQVDELQHGSTDERQAIKAYVTRLLERKVGKNSVPPQVLEVLQQIVTWIEGREKRTDARKGGL